MKKISKLAGKILDFSCQVKKHDKVIIEMTGEPARPLVKALIKGLNERECSITFINKEMDILAELLMGATVHSIEYMAQRDLQVIEEADVYIMVKSIEDPSVMNGVPSNQMDLYADHYTKIINPAILNRPRWISLRYPNHAMAERAGMSLEAFTDYYFEACLMDYQALIGGMSYLVDLMKATDQVRICGPGTDINFSIKDMPAHMCAGKINLPDGEVYTAPIRDSINGYITFNTPTIYMGHEFTDIHLEFKNGKIVKATSNQSLELNKILDTDDGARYIGEFSLGVNPFIKAPIKDILFDEKIGGSFHLTPGFAYSDANNGNSSAIHWDLVCIQTEAFGGGEIYFDNKLIRKDGKFLLEDLCPLNPK
jgi:aminopeptidase